MSDLLDTPWLDMERPDHRIAWVAAMELMPRAPSVETAAFYPRVAAAAHRAAADIAKEFAATIANMASKRRAPGWGTDG